MAWCIVVLDLFYACLALLNHCCECFPFVSLVLTCFLFGFAPVADEETLRIVVSVTMVIMFLGIKLESNTSEDTPTHPLHPAIPRQEKKLSMGSASGSSGQLQAGREVWNNFKEIRPE